VAPSLPGVDAGGALLLDLPWHLPLQDWPAEQPVALPRGLSRHVVRFVRVCGRVCAVEEAGGALRLPDVGAVPRELHGKLEPVQVFHELLEHRWFLSGAGTDVGIDEAAGTYVGEVLPGKPDERAVLGERLGRPTVEDPTLGRP
jgi:hypothetical protein